MLGNILSGECGAEPTQIGSVLSNACPSEIPIVGNVLTPCECEEEVTLPDPFIDLQSESGSFQSLAGIDSSSAQSEGESTGSYPLGMVVAILIHPYQIVGGVKYYESGFARSIEVPNNDAEILWSYIPTTGRVDGYILTRSLDGAGYTDFQDVGALENFFDDGVTGWATGAIPATQSALVTASSLTDQTANANHVIQETAVNRPIYLPDELNSLPAIRLDDNDCLLRPDLTGDTDSPFTIQLVAKLVPVAGAIVSFGFVGLLTNGGVVELYTIAGAPLVSTYEPSGEYSVIQAIFGAGGVARLYVDGVLYATGSTGANAATALALNQTLSPVGMDFFQLKGWPGAFSVAQLQLARTQALNKYDL